MNTGSTLEDLPGVIDDWEGQRERVWEIHAVSVTWWLFCYVLTLRPGPKMLFQGDTPEGSDTFQWPVRDREGGLRLMIWDKVKVPLCRYSDAPEESNLWTAWQDDWEGQRERVWEIHAVSVTWWLFCYVLTLRPGPKMLFQGDTPEGSDTFQWPVRDREGGLRLMIWDKVKVPLCRYSDAPEESNLWTAWQLFPLDDD